MDITTDEIGNLLFPPPDAKPKPWWRQRLSGLASGGASAQGRGQLAGGGGAGTATSGATVRGGGGGRGGVVNELAQAPGPGAEGSGLVELEVLVYFDVEIKASIDSCSAEKGFHCYK